MADKKKKKRMTLGEAQSRLTPKQRANLDKGYSQYQRKRILEAGGDAAIAPKKRWMEIWKGSKKFK